jgi:hypothetical protein
MSHQKHCRQPPLEQLTQCFLTSGWPLRVVRMSGVAKGVRVMATSTPALQKGSI